MGNIKDVCFKYFNGISTIDDEKAIYAFISESDDNKALFEQWKSEWKGGTPANHQIFSFNKIKAEIQTRRKNRIKRVFSYSLAVAASLAFFITLVLTMRPDSTLPERCIVKTGYNEKQKVVLPDNTVVWINAGSCLTYSEAFVVDQREVSLQGEAYFDVAPMQDVPFVVHLAGSDITVKGTRFNVSAYSKEAEIATSLIEGSIVFTSDKVSVEMIPGEQLVYNVHTEDITKTKIDTRPTISWVNGKLDYASITLPKLLSRLSLLYGVEFRYTPIKYKNRNIRIKLNDSEPIEDVLGAISIILPIDYEIEDDIVTVTEK